MTELKYLFEAHLNDGTVIQQRPDDISQTDPTKSAFYDVLQRMDDVIAFGLFSDQDEATYVVCLSDGHFEINGNQFHAQDPSVKLPEGLTFRLVYFRRNVLNFIANADSMEQQSHTITYHIGWQTTVDGKNVQQTISVS